MKPIRCLAAAAALAVSGCHRPPNGAGLAGLPPAGEVRILTQRIRDDDRAFEWQWTIVGDRNWTECGHRGATFTLAGSYPLNSLHGAGGTHIWVMTVSVRKETVAGRPPVLRSDLLLRGSNAKATSTGSVLGQQADRLNQVVQSQQTGNATVDLPTTVPLARIGSQTVEIKIDR